MPHDTSYSHDGGAKTIMFRLNMFSINGKWKWAKTKSLTFVGLMEGLHRYQRRCFVRTDLNAVRGYLWPDPISAKLFY